MRELRSAKRCASSSADGPPAPVTSAHISSKPASTKCSGSWIRPLSSSRRPADEHGAAHDARRPDVAEDAPLVAEAVHRAAPRRAARRTRARCSSGTCARMSAMRASTSAVSLSPRRRRTVGSRAAARRAARARSARRCRSRRAADTRRGRDTPTSPGRRRRRTRAARRASCRGRRRTRGAREPPCRCVIAAMSRSSSPDAPADTGAAPRIIASASAGGTLGPRSRGARAGRRPAASPTPVNRMCWKIICEWWSRQRVEVRDQLVVGERVGVDRLQLAVGLDRGRLERLVPLAELLAPDLALPHLLGAREALRDLVVGCRMHRAVREAVDVLRSPSTRASVP